MSIHLENEGKEFFDEEQFRKEICGICRFKDVCDEWELKTFKTLYDNKNRSTNELLKSHFSGKKGVYRCASFEGEE